jgi:predicted DNA binding CopG/RHH family protein
VTIRLGVDVIEYFKGMAKETGIPYQNLINLYLSDCAQSQRTLQLQWAP